MKRILQYGALTLVVVCVVFILMRRQTERPDSGRHLASVKDNGPLAFHAKIIDQHGRPAAGVKIRAEITGYNENVLEQQQRGAAAEGSAVASEFITLESDQEGLIHLTGRRGRWLNIQSFESGDFVLPDKRDRSRGFYQWSFGYGGHLDKKGIPYYDPNFRT